MNKTDLYQNKPKLVQIYRWLQWKPLYSLLYCWWIAKWIIVGCKMSDDYIPFGTRTQMIKHMWVYHMALASVKMRHLYTLEEIIGNLKEGPTC